MDLEKVLQQLHEELENLNAAISSLERLQEAGKHHQSQEMEWLGNVTDQVPGVRKRKSKAKPRDDLPKTEPATETTGESE